MPRALKNLKNPTFCTTYFSHICENLFLFQNLLKVLNGFINNFPWTFRALFVFIYAQHQHPIKSAIISKFKNLGKIRAKLPVRFVHFTVDIVIVLRPEWVHPLCGGFFWKILAASSYHTVRATIEAANFHHKI